jgi:two-component system invasion response regulator UvrY
MSNPEKILIAIADDHILLRRGLADLIDDFGPFKVIMEANDGMEMVEKLSNASILPDICIVDINMPELDGFGTLIEIKKRWPAIKILALSMYNNEFTIIRMLRNGASGYLLKNCNPNEFKNALLGIYEKGFYEGGLIEKNIFSKSIHEQLITITPKELEFLVLCCSELAYKEIADRMGISPRTVEDHRDNLFRKLKLNTRTGLVMYAMKAGLVS